MALFQDPVLFTGTLRKNLDPFDHYSDQQLNTALDEVCNSSGSSSSMLLYVHGSEMAY